jgi:hypothetical protein
MGEGRQSTRRVLAAKSGDAATADALKPPSERRLTDEQRCGALTQAGAPCKLQKGSKTDHPGYGNCAKHGGNTEAGVKSAMRAMGADLAQTYKRDFLRFGGDRRDPSIANLTPEQALLEEVRRSAALVRFLEERIAQWNLAPAQHATLEAFANTPKKFRRADDPSLKAEVEAVFASLEADNPDSPDYLPPLTSIHPKTGFTSFTDAREWLYLYREERSHLARVAKMAIDAGVANRLVSIAEDQGRILASAIRAVLTALNLTPDQASMVPHIVPPILRAVASDSPIPDISSLTATPNPEKDSA